MSSPEPAPKQTRQDGARQVAAVAPRAPDQTSAGPASAGQIAANGQAGTAATQRMVADGEANHDSKWMAGWHGVEDGAQIVGEILKLALFNPFTGAFSGNLELGKALYYAQLFAPRSALSMIALHGANRGSNPVHVNLNLYHKTFDLTAAQLAVAGFHTGTATGQACELTGLTAHAQGGVVTLQIAGATLHDVTFIRGDQQLHARDVGMRGLSATATNAASLETALHFTEAHVHGLVYPNAAPLDLDLPGGTSLDAVWTHQAAPTAPAPQTHAALPPAPDVLPPGSRVTVQLTGLQAAAVVAGDQTHGTGGFAQLRVALVKDGADLATIVVNGFHAGGSAAVAGATIDQLVLTGAPPLVDALLANQQLASDPHVRAAMQLVHTLGIKPAVSGSVTFDHVGLEHGAGGDRATGNFASTIALAGVGKLDVAMTKFTVGTADASGGFDKFDTTLRDEAGKELAHVTINGVSARAVDPKTRTAEVHRFHARGDVGAIVRAGDAIIRQLPLTVRSGFALIRSLGVTGDLDGTLSAKSTSGATEVSGSFTAHLQAGTAGAIAVSIADFHGSEANAAGATFRDFTATLTNAKGHAAATVHMTNGAFVQRGTQGATSTAFKAGKIDARGNSADITAMMSAIEKQSPDLSPPVRVAFGLVRSYYVSSGGTLAMSGVDVSEGADGADTARIARADASFALATGEHVVASVTGLHGGKNARSTDVQFDQFDATLDGAAGGGHARVHLERAGAQVSAAPTKAGAAPDFSVHSHQATFDGEAQDIAKLVTGLHAHLGTMPAPIAQAFEVVGRYATAQTKDAVSTTVSATDLAFAESHGQETSHGDVSARVALAGDVVSVAVHGFVGTGHDVKFTGLDLTVAGPGGATAATLHAGSTHLDRNGVATVADVTASGDAARLRQVVDALGKRVPESVSRALAAVGPSRVDAAISSISVAPTANGGLVTDAAVMRVSAAILVSAGDTVYKSPNAALAIYGAHVTLGPDHKPREIDAMRLEVTGNFASLGTGRDLVGNATIHTGAAKIMFDAAGTVTGVQTSQLQVSGDVTATTQPGAAPIAAVPPTRTQRLASHDQLAAQAEGVASAVRAADIRASTPILAGRYGSGLLHIDVPSGATIETSVEVQDYALTNGTRVALQPKLSALWVKAAGVDLETSGTQGALEARLDWFPDLNLTKYVVGQKKLSLDLGTLVGEVMDHMRKSIETAEQTAQKSAPPERDDDGLVKKHAKWQHDAARHTTPKQRAQDAATEPRSTSVADLATKGIQPALTTGRGDVEVASRDGQIDAHLHGEAAAGGVMRMSATDAHAQIAGQTVDAKGVDTGPVTVAMTGNTTHVQLSGFSIETLRWLGS